MIDHKKLLEHAAKAAGYEFSVTKFGIPKADGIHWNPLESDGQAFRLFVDLFFMIKHFRNYEEEIGFVEIWQEDDEDPIHTEFYKSTTERRQAVRSAITIAASKRYQERT